MQSSIDLKADEVIFNHLKASGVVHSAASEERPYVSIKAISYVLMNHYSL
jgi:fructose-1,6-bisphosphatase